MSAKSEMLWRGVALAGLVAGAAALALQFTGRAGDRAATPAAAPSMPRASAAEALAGRTATLSRLLSERRAVARIELVFGAKGVLGVACRAEAADGAIAACFGDEKGAGTWSVEGASLCIAAAVLGLASPHCYQLGGEPPALTLVGPGFLAGNMQLR
jgi:hypothetical protein